MEIVTERLVITPILPNEAARIVAGIPGPDEHWHDQYPLADELDILRPLSGAQAPDPVFTAYKIALRDGGLAIGGIGFFGPPDPNGAVEIGYGLVGAERGKGFATEAATAMVAFAFARGARVVMADALVDNQASGGVLATCGFVEVGRSGGLAHYRVGGPT